VVDIVSSIPGKPVPKDRNVWPCQGLHHDDNFCSDPLSNKFAPQMKLIAAANQ
jgi:hypothetical protein